jgi:hypothetical protein
MTQGKIFLISSILVDQKMMIMIRIIIIMIAIMILIIIIIFDKNCHDHLSEVYTPKQPSPSSHPRRGSP